MRCSSVLCSLALTFGIVAPVAVAAQGGSVAGTVMNRATGAPVAAAQVTVAGAALRAFTDASGRFTLNDVPGATAVLQVRLIGFRARTDTVNVGETNLDCGSCSISRFNDFKPDDIASIEILKGPAAATLYGTEASNGVIQIISKRGTPGPARWDFTVRQGLHYVSNPEGRFPTNYQVDGSGNLLSINMRDLEAQVGDIFRTGHLADYQASVSGGSNALRYYVAGGTELQGGAEPSNDFRHTSGRASVTATPSDKVTVAANVGYVSGPTHLSCEAGCGGRVYTTIYANPRNVGNPIRLGFHSGLPAEYDEVYHFTQGLDRFTRSVQLE